ncbi:MAG TPA: tyrosinase family protein, partial [Allosphingosinicella sp.]
VLQAAAGNPSLRLPYWDYETDGRIPAAYRSPTYVNSNNQTVPNPLYVANRQPQLATGSALTPAVVSTAGAMPATSYSPFNSALEQTPHGSVHCATGVQSCPSGYMGYVPTAGNDPIFFSHHANIDRLYECWLKVNPAQRLPGGAMLNATFSFIDGAGNLVTRKVGDMLTTQQLNYGYTAGGGCPSARLINSNLVWREVPWKVFPLTGAVRFDRGTTVVPLRLPAELRSQLLAPGALNRASARQATLVIDDVSFEESPGAMYEIFMEGANGRRVPVGVLNFFTETAPGHGDSAGMAAASGEKRFDATAALRALGPAVGDARLVFEPTSGVAGVKPAAGTVNLAGTLRFREARLELR